MAKDPIAKKGTRNDGPEMEVDSNSAPPAWDPDRCMAALNTLDQLQDQINRLRTAIPNLLDNMRNHDLASAAPQHLFDTFSHSANSANSAIRDLHLSWNDENTQRILTCAQDSAADPSLENNQSWDFPDIFVPHWAGNGTGEGKRKSTGLFATVLTASNGLSGTLNGSMDGLGDGHDTSLEEEDAIIEKVSRDYEGRIKINKDSRTDVIQIELMSQIFPLSFSVERQKLNKDPKNSYRVTCTSRIYMADAVTRCAGQRSHQGNLKYALEMIAGFEKHEMSPCHKCGELLDGSAMTPVAMRKVSQPGCAGSWLPFHEACMD